MNSTPLQQPDSTHTATATVVAGAPVPHAPPCLPEGADFVDRVFAYLLAEFPQIAGPRFAQAERAVREELAGERVYVSARGVGDRQALAREVLSLFNGRNASEVARRLNIGRATVYRLLKQPRNNA